MTGCPNGCDAPVGDIEIQGVYDGALIRRCTACRAEWPRFPDGRLHVNAVEILDRWNVARAEQAAAETIDRWAADRATAADQADGGAR